MEIFQYLYKIIFELCDKKIVITNSVDGINHSGSATNSDDSVILKDDLLTLI